jgi:hypothetical protein
MVLALMLGRHFIDVEGKRYGVAGSVKVDRHVRAA